MSSATPTPLPSGGLRWVSIVSLTLLFGVLNCLKPMHIDDSCFYEYAVQVAQAPLDPYGFDVLWFQHPQAANELPNPPVVPYYLAPATMFFAGHPWLLKLWMLPFALLLVVALDSLLRRFAPRLAGPLLWMLVLSPAMLPSFNLMIDVPALALNLASLAWFLRAIDRASWGGVVGAGLLAGLSIQTKYTGFTAPAAILLYATMFDRWRQGLLAGLVSAIVFASFELFTAHLYGTSHFLAALGSHDPTLHSKFKLISALVRILGATHGAGAVLGLLVLGQPVRRVGWFALLLVAGIAGVAWLPGSASDAVANFVFGFAGVVVLVTMFRAALHHVSWSRQSGGEHAAWTARREDWFLLAWLILELVAYAILSPFSAVRRVLSVLVVGTIVIGHRAKGIQLSTATQRYVRLAATASVALGLLFQTVDLHEAQAVRLAAQRTAALLPADEEATVWYVGHWGFTYYARQAGWRQVVPKRSQLRPGDWLVKPGARLGQQQLDLAAAPLEWFERVVASDRLPWQTMANYYAGRRPLERHRGARLTVDIYRVTDAFVAREPLGFESVAIGAGRPKKARR